MRAIEPSNQFLRDFKRERRGRHQGTLSESLSAILDRLAADLPLEPRYRDHALVGNWKDCRDCHIKPDLVLIYQKPDAYTLKLIRLGSHAELEL